MPKLTRQVSEKGSKRGQKGGFLRAGVCPPTLSRVSFCWQGRVIFQETLLITYALTEFKTSENPSFLRNHANYICHSRMLELASTFCWQIVYFLLMLLLFVHFLAYFKDRYFGVLFKSGLKVA